MKTLRRPFFPNSFNFILHSTDRGSLFGDYATQTNFRISIFDSIRQKTSAAFQIIEDFTGIFDLADRKRGQRAKNRLPKIAPYIEKYHIKRTIARKKTIEDITFSDRFSERMWSKFNEDYNKNVGYNNSVDMTIHDIFINIAVFSGQNLGPVQDEYMKILAKFHEKRKRKK